MVLNNLFFCCSHSKYWNSQKIKVGLFPIPVQDFQWCLWLRIIVLHSSFYKNIKNAKSEWILWYIRLSALRTVLLGFIWAGSQAFWNESLEESLFIDGGLFYTFWNQSVSFPRMAIKNIFMLRKQSLEALNIRWAWFGFL